MLGCLRSVHISNGLKRASDVTQLTGASYNELFRQCLTGPGNLGVWSTYMEGDIMMSLIQARVIGAMISLDSSKILNQLVSSEHTTLASVLLVRAANKVANGQLPDGAPPFFDYFGPMWLFVLEGALARDDEGPATEAVEANLLFVLELWLIVYPDIRFSALSLRCCLRTEIVYLLTHS